MNTYGIVDRLNHCRETGWSVVKVKPLGREGEREGEGERERERGRGREGEGERERERGRGREGERERERGREGEREREREREREDTIIVLDYEPVCVILMERVLCWDEN